jgi:hypothetical protein
MLLASPFGDNPRKLTIGPNGNLFAAYAAPASLVAGHNGTTGVFVANFVSHESEGLLSPVGVGFGVDGNFYAACQGTNQILRSNRSTGAFMDAFVSAGSGGLSGPLLRDCGRRTRTIDSSDHLVHRTAAFYHLLSTRAAGSLVSANSSDSP